MVPGRAAATGAVQAVVEKAPPTIDSHGERLQPVAPTGASGGGLSLAGAVTAAIFLTSPVSALLYGFVYSRRGPSPFRTAIKTLPVGVLALYATVASQATYVPGQGDPNTTWSILAAGFALCAVGDAFLAGDPKRWLAPGLAAFLLGHICFIALFGHALAVAGLPLIGPAILIGMALIVLTGGAMLAWLWRDLGTLRWPVVAYVVVIAVMACTGLIDAVSRPAWAVGGVLFMASDAILAVQLFKQRELLVSPRLNAWAIWFLYYFAQVAFLVGALS
ncbi:MAG: lysoplasmalogenase [Caulobacter sp.]|nr:lysoplasmalogenase [Caulobacter sp.]